MTQAPESRENYCYRHPQRQSFVLCQRCGRTICPECQTQAPVGVICPECMRESRQSAPRVKPRVVTSMRSSVRSGAPVVTIAIIAICVVVVVAELISGGFVGQVTNDLAYVPLRGDTTTAPWRMITSLFVHLSWLHILFNMYSLFIFGSALERMLGRVRFAALFLLAGFGGSVGVEIATIVTHQNLLVAGASGAIFGMFGAYFVIMRRLGGNTVQLLVVIAINLVIGFVVPGIAWQAHVGGLLVGAAIGLIYLETRERRRRGIQIGALAGLFALLAIVAGVAALAVS